MRNAFLDAAAPVEARRAWTRLRELQHEKASVEAAITTAMVMQELPEPRPAYVLKRGSYDARGDKVERGVPAVLPAMPATTGRTTVLGSRDGWLAPNIPSPHA